MDVPNIDPEIFSPLFRWSKQVEAAQLAWWETELTAAGILFVAEKAVKRQRWQISVYEKERAAAADLQTRFGGGVAEIRPESWAPQAETAAPILIRNRLAITESDDAGEIARLESAYPEREVLSFPPRLAFGTGSHPTTASCLRLLADTATGFDTGRWNLLDLGAGSGILAIAAERLGAGSALAIECDPLAVGVAEENARRHGTARVTFVLAELTGWLGRKDPDRGQTLFDVVTANLFSDLLTDVFPLLPRWMSREGRVIVSGFLTSQAGQVTGAARAAGLDFDRFLRRGKWVAGTGKLRVPHSVRGGAPADGPL